MSNPLTITSEDILKEIKLSLKLPDLIEAIATRRLIREYAEEASIGVNDEALQKTADSLRLIYNIPTTQETVNWLKKHSLSLDEFEEIAYDTLISGKLAKHLFSAQVEPHYYENQLDYVGVVMYEIILDDQDLAIELYYAIQENEISFYEAAHKYIKDKELRRKGGYCGTVYRKDLKPEVSAAVFAIQSPKLLKPIITSKGLHLIMVEEFVQPELDEKIKNKIVSELFYEWLKKQIQQLEIISTV
jgi:parvulin-like peptidyl-prolyl isomerase